MIGVILWDSSGVCIANVWGYMGMWNGWMDGRMGRKWMCHCRKGPSSRWWKNWWFVESINNSHPLSPHPSTYHPTTFQYPQKINHTTCNYYCSRCILFQYIENWSCSEWVWVTKGVRWTRVVNGVGIGPRWRPKGQNVQDWSKLVQIDQPDQFSPSQYY